MPPPRISFKNRGAQEEWIRGEDDDGKKMKQVEEVAAHREAPMATQAEEGKNPPGIIRQVERENLGEANRKEEGVDRSDVIQQEGRGDRGLVTEKGGEEDQAGRRRGKRKQRDYEVFIGGLDRETTERDIVKVFKDVGEVVEVRLVRRSFGPKSKGFAFVRFATVEQAKAATEVRYVQVRGRSCGVTRSNNHETLHVGNICTSWTRDDLVRKLSAFKLENLEEVHLMEDPLNKGKNRGYAFLDFGTHMDALAACCKLQKEQIFLGTDVRADVAFSRSIEPATEIMSRVRSVFLDGLPTNWDEKRIQLHFEKFGDIENIQLASDMPTAKRKDFGFVNFRFREDALNCIEKINKDGIYEGNVKVPVKASLKKPLLKRFTQMVGTRRDYIRNDYTRSGSQTQYEDFSSYPSRSTRTHESISRHRSFRTRDFSPCSSREAGYYSYALSPDTEKYEDHTRRRHGVTDSSSRSRGHHYEGKSSGKLALERCRNLQPTYKELPRSHYYADESDEEICYAYESEYSPYESRDLEFFDHPIRAGQKRHYMEEDDTLVSGSMLRRHKSRPGYEFDDYVPPDDYVSTEVSRYDRYTRFLPEKHSFYDRVQYTSSNYGTRYLSSRDVIRSYR